MKTKSTQDEGMILHFEDKLPKKVTLPLKSDSPSLNFCWVENILTSLFFLKIFNINDAARYSLIQFIFPMVLWLRKLRPHRCDSKSHIFFCIT